MSWLRVKEQLTVEYERYSKHKKGKIVALLIYFCAFAILPQITNRVVAELIKYMSEPWAYVVIVSFAMSFVELSWIFVMYFIYTKKIPFFEQYRFNPKNPWPWQVDSQGWKPLFWSSVGYTAFNIFLFFPLKLLLDSQLSFKTVMDPAKTPTFSQMAVQYLIMIICEDAAAFTSHYLMHTPKLYRFHKVHHEYSTSIVLAGLHFQFFDLLLGQTLSALITMKVGAMYAPLHISFIVSFLALRVSDNNGTHCGYNFSWIPIQALPFCANEDFHDYHHSHNVGNFAPLFRTWDTLFGTNESFRIYKAKRRALEIKEQQAKKTHEAKSGDKSD